VTSKTFVVGGGNVRSRETLVRYLNALPIAARWRIAVAPYKRDRSVEQNAVSHGWYAQIARELHEDTPEGIKRFCKLTLGVPILRGADADFCAFYDRALKGLEYEQKLEAMKYLDVSSLMTTDQMLEYMTAMQDTYAGRVDLRYPNDPPDAWQ